MKLLFWAVLLTAIDLPVPLSGGGILDLVPDWLGLALLVRGARNLTAESTRFLRLQRWSSGLCLWSGCVWLGRLALGGAGIPLLRYGYSWLLLWLLWLLTEGISDTERRRNADLGSAWLRRCGGILAACTVAQVYPVFLGDILPHWVATALTTGQLLAMVLYLWGLWRVQGSYREAVAFSQRRK